MYFLSPRRPLRNETRKLPHGRYADVLLDEVRIEMGMREPLGPLKDLHDENDGDDITDVGAFGGARTASDYGTDTTKGVGDKTQSPRWRRTRGRACRWERWAIP